MEYLFNFFLCLNIILLSTGIFVKWFNSNKLDFNPSSRSWLLYAISSEIEAIWASKDEFKQKLIFFLKKLFPKILFILVKSLIGPLCLIKPSNVSIERLRPLKS